MQCESSVHWIINRIHFRLGCKLSFSVLMNGKLSTRIGEYITITLCMYLHNQDTKLCVSLTLQSEMESLKVFHGYLMNRWKKCVHKLLYTFIKL